MGGWKTWIGTIGFGVCHGLAAIFPDYASALQTIAVTVFVPMGVIGIAHKIEKAR